MAMRNYNNYKEFITVKKNAKVSTFDKAGLFMIPMICFLGGSINLYLAIDILKSYQQER